MMTREEELERTIEDRDQAENDREWYNEQLSQLELYGACESEDYGIDDIEQLEGIVNELDNQIMYLNHAIESLEDE